jgi:transcriptional regulator with XRE-family HTH domain
MLIQNSRYHLKSFQAQATVLTVKVIPEMPDSLGNIIRRRMKEVGIDTASELGRRIGVSSAYASDLINDSGKTRSGTYTPSFDVIRNLATVLKVPATQLLEPFGLAEGVQFTVSDEARVSLLKDYSPEELDEFRRAFEDAAFIALRRIEEKRKNK